MREVWTAQVHDGGAGRYVSASLSVRDGGGFVLEVDGYGDDRKVSIDHDDAVRLSEVLEDELHRGPTS